MGLTGWCWGYWLHRDGSGSFCSVLFCLPFTLLPSTSLLCLASLLSLCLSPSLTHAVSKQTVLSRSISGCHAVDEKNKIKNRRREKERYFPAAYRSRKLKSLYSESDTQQKGQFVTETQKRTSWHEMGLKIPKPFLTSHTQQSHWLRVSPVTAACIPINNRNR